MTTRRGALAVCLALAFAPLAFGDDTKKAEVSGDLKKMQGTWTSKDDQGESTWTIKGDKMSIKAPTRAYEITLKLDSDAKPTATMDMKVGDDSPNAKGIMGLAIYKFDGDKKMSICFATGDNPRPTEFKTDTESFKSFSFELTRKGD